MHSGEKLKKCNQCNYASSQAGDLRKHLKTHSGEKSNKCNKCGYAFSQAGNLWIYMKTNSTRVVGVFGGAQLAKLELLTPAPVLLSIQYLVNLGVSVSKPDTVAL